MRALKDLSENDEFQVIKVEDGMISGIRSTLAAAEVMTVGKPSLNAAAALDLKIISVENDSKVFMGLESGGLPSVDAGRLLKKNLENEVSLQKATQLKHIKILYKTSW
ncbi:MAG: hypothetical protein ACKERG_01105 [Candidatus Hodgkinia cicadicola]